MNLIEGLTNEIERNVIIRGHYEELRRAQNVFVEPQIAWFTAEIDAAKKAMAEGDVVAMLRAYAALKETQS